MSTSPPTALPGHEDLIDAGAAFLNAMLDSATPDLLGKDYWRRARTALSRSASSLTFAEMTSKCADKLEIGDLGGQSAAVIGTLRGQFSDPAVFRAFARACRRDAVVVTAMARIARDERRQAAKAAKAAKAAESDTREPGF